MVRSYDFGEADRIIVLLTRDRGLVRGVAKGVRRSKSRFGSRLQVLVELDVQLYEGRSLHSITAADTVQFLAAGVIDDFTRYTAALGVLEAAERLSESFHGEHAQLYDLAVGCLGEVQQAPDPVLVLDTFILQATTLSGWAPSLFHCGSCGRPGPHHAFHTRAGGAVCGSCRPPGSLDVPEEVLHAMWLLSQGHTQYALAVMAPLPEAAATIHHLTKIFVQFHTEKALSSLNVLEQI